MSESLNEPLRTLHGAKVRTDDQVYQTSSVDLYDGWIEVWTDREQESTDYHLMIPCEKVNEVVFEHS